MRNGQVKRLAGVGVAPGAEATDREAPLDAHAPHVAGDPAGERFDAGDADAPLAECLPSHRTHHGFQSVRLTPGTTFRPAPLLEHDRQRARARVQCLVRGRCHVETTRSAQHS